MISIITTTSDHKIKVKSDETLDKTLNRTFNEIHETDVHDENKLSDEIIVDQKTVFLSKNMIIVEKIISVLIMIIHIIQFTSVNTHLTQIEYL